MRREKPQRADRNGRATRKNLNKLLAVTAIALCSRPLLGQTLTWDSSGATPATPVDGSGNWNTVTPSNWTDGVSNFAWVNGDIAAVGSGGAAGTITIDDASGTVQAAGISFNGVGSGNYTVVGSGTNTLTLVGSGVVNVASGLSPTIAAPIVGSAGLTVIGPGTLNVSGACSYTGNVAINSGTFVVAAGGNFGASSNGVALGTSNDGSSTGDATAAGVVAAGVNATINSFKTSTNNSVNANTLLIDTGATLNVTSNSAMSGLNGTVNGAFVVGTPNLLGPMTTKLTISGAGTLNVSGGTNNASFLVGVGNCNTSANVMSPTLDMSGLSNFTFVTGTGAVPTTGGNEFAVGHGRGATATMSLAVNSSITANTISVGDGNLTPGLTGVDPAPNAPSNLNTLNLGSGTNVFHADNIIIGKLRTNATVKWANGVNTGTLTITGSAGGASTANITLGTLQPGTPPGTASSLDVSGHTANIQAGTVIVGNLAGGTGGTSTSKGGSVIFDTGTFNIQNLQLAVGTSGTSGGAIAGTFRVGSSANSTGVVNVTNQFLIGNNTGATSASPKGTLDIRGGTLNVFTNIIDTSNGVPASTSVLSLTGGTLNMNGFAIGTTAGGTGGLRTIPTVTFPSGGNTAVLMNLGGNGINNAGLTMNTAGNLTITGTTSTYTGGTNITAGFLQFGAAIDTAAPNGIGAGTVTNSATLLYGSSQSPSIGNVISGAGTVAMVGSGTTTPTANNTYTGPTQAAAGILSTASIPNGGLSSPIGGATSAASNLVLTGGTLQYTGAGTSTNRLLTITANGGAIDASGSGPIDFNNSGAVVSADAPSRSVTETTSSTRVLAAGVLDLSVGMSVTGANIPPGTTITAVNKFTGAITLSNTPTASGTEVVSFPGVLARTVTLTGTNTGDNTMGNVLGDSAGGGMLGVTKSGSGTWVLGAINTYSGRTSVNGGILKVAGSSNLGNGSVTNDVALAGGGTLQATGALNGSGRNVTLNSGGGGIDTNSHPVAFADVDGNGNFTKSGGGTLAVNHVRSGGALTVTGGKLAINANGNAAGVSVANATSVVGAQLDLSDNHLIDHTSSIGTWTGSSYDGLTGLVASGRNTGNWNGNGIVTSQTQAIGGNLTSIGIARASDVRPTTVTATDLWAGQTITGTDTLVMYTYGGDATLDGKINIDDYVKIDSGIASGLTGWVNGDFNYDGKVNIDDYTTVIDANIGNQNGVFYTSGGISGGLSGVTAVPEPTSLALLGIAALGLPLRGRRRRKLETI